MHGQSGLRIGRLSLRGVLCSTKTTLTPTVSATTGGKNAGHPRWYAGIKKVPANGGPVVGVAGQRLTWKARGEDIAYIFSTYEMTLFPEKAVALHYHPYAEVFYVLDGEVEFGSMKDGREEWIPCLAGETVIAGPDVVHGFATAPVSRRAFSAFLLSSTRRFLTNVRLQPKGMIRYRLFLTARSSNVCSRVRQSTRYICLSKNEVDVCAPPKTEGAHTPCISSMKRLLTRCTGTLKGARSRCWHLCARLAAKIWG